MKKYFLLAVLSGLLLAAAWPARGIAVLIFIAFVPLLLLEEGVAVATEIKRKKIKIFGFSFIAFFIWNLLTTWWLYNSLNPDGSHALIAVAVPVLLNSTMMSFVVLFYHVFKKRCGRILGLLFFIALWICFEKFHTTWQFSWPWLTLGNAFSGWHKWVQWYDVTGVFGGSLWVLIANTIVFLGIFNFNIKKQKILLVKYGAWFILMIGVPLVISLVKYARIPLASEQKVSTVLLQPKLDPYGEKYQLSAEKITKDLLDLAEINTKGQVDFFIAPETAIPGRGGISENDFATDPIIQQVKAFTAQYPQAVFITGASTYKMYPNEASKSNTAYFLPQYGLWIDSYNTALEIIPGEKVKTYHKGKLVPGVESFPYINVLKPLLGDAMLNMGGTVASLGSDSIRKVFINPFNPAKIAPIICYESAYGEYVTGYVKNGANLLAIVTNDSWWGNSPGHRQLLQLAKLRAIETRKEIVRAANSGISAHINRRGDVVESLPYDEKGALKVKANLFSGASFYVKHGDFIYKLALLTLGILFVYCCFKTLIKKDKPQG